MSRMKELIETIRKLMQGEFSGYIKINFSQGSLGRVEQSEELNAIISCSGEKNVRNKKGDRNLRDNKAIDIDNRTGVKGHFDPGSH